MFVPFLSLTAQEREEVFIGPVAETALFSASGTAWGGGLILGCGYGQSIGIKIFYAAAADTTTTLETTVFIRFYLSRYRKNNNLFLQLNAGSVLFAKYGPLGLPARSGTFSSGLTAGWRFLLGEHWYIEPAVRAGYPYMAGGGISAGYRF
jgi:hypothetical protein